MKTYGLTLEWEPLPAGLGNAQQRLGEALEAWCGTPYLSGQRLRGIGGDCIGSVFGVLDDVDGRQRALDPMLPADTALHNPKLAYKAVAAIRHIYAPAKRLRREGGRMSVQPGDLLVVGTTYGGPGHLMLVGVKKNTIWHAAGRGARFEQTGWALGDGFERLFAVYRLEDRERWMR